MTNYFMEGKPTRGRRRLQMSKDLYVNNGYEVLKGTAENGSVWREKVSEWH